MNGIEYIGERLWAGQLGHGLVILSFVAALIATIAYTSSANQKKDLADRSWLKIGKWAFAIHGISVFAVIGLIFYMMTNHFFEYEYVWGHVSEDLPFRYVFSAFWEGQEGSFLLWSFWHVVLGFVLMKKAGSWESPVMAVFAIVQTIISSMLLGFYITEGDGRVGSSPFVLLRETNFAPMFSMSNYVQMLEGKGLNPLLQNYWMTIHPPTLFLGFAATIVPFAYAIAGLWKKEHKAWMVPALKWSLFAAAILGIGIAMGAVWAYEALSFGGYWAWDPVENASLVPWLTLVAGIHTILIAKNTGHSIKSSYFYLLITFFLIVYSTFLTRSGILGEMSVHSFTEMGLEWQLIIFLGVSAALALGFYFANSKSIPVIEKEESAYSKEFWLFIGALVLLFSACFITFTTSIPVFNKIFGLFGVEGKLAPPEDVVEHHNRYQLFIGVLIAFLSGFSQFLRYRATEMTTIHRANFLKHFVIHLVISVAITIPFMWYSTIIAWQHWLLVWASIYTCVANIDYVISVLKGKIKVSGSAVSHIGFGLLMIGAVWSGALKYPISEGFTSIDDALGDLNKQTNKSVLLIKGREEQIRNGYHVTYVGDSIVENSMLVILDFKRKDKDGNIVEQFQTYPNVLRTKQDDGSFKFAAANPSTKHHLFYDVFTLAIPDWAFDTPEDTAKVDSTGKQWQTHEIKLGDTIFTSKNYMILKQMNANPKHEEYQPLADDIAVAAVFEVHNIEGRPAKELSPLYFIRDASSYDITAKNEEIGLSVRMTKIIPAEEKFQFEILDEKPKESYVVMQGIVFPMINFVWAGIILMMLGLLMGLWQKFKKSK